MSDMLAGRFSDNNNADEKKESPIRRVLASIHRESHDPKPATVTGRLKAMIYAFLKVGHRVFFRFILLNFVSGLTHTTSMNGVPLSVTQQHLRSERQHPRHWMLCTCNRCDFCSRALTNKN